MPTIPRTKSSTAIVSASEPLRFAHPFFVANPPRASAAAKKFGTTLLDHIASTLGPVPATKRTGWFTLADVIGRSGAADIQASGKITLHLAGDTGVPEIDRETRQVTVSDAMAKDYFATAPAKSPAFFLHLGDVVYGPNPQGYLDQFFRPYMHYPGKIIAVPGNHDGESDIKLKAFQDNFCAASQKIPAIAGSIFRQTMNQPGVYWCLDAPFVQIVGLYSNNAENPGSISGGVGGPAQLQWLVKTLKKIAAQRKAAPRKALLFATHHPPYTSGGHSGSAAMLQEIDEACTQAGILPDAFFSGHAHSLQRYTRTMKSGSKTVQIPYIVSGCGGHGGQVVATPVAATGVNPIFNFSYKGWGYTKVEVGATGLTITAFGVDEATIRKVDAVNVTF